MVETRCSPVVSGRALCVSGGCGQWHCVAQGSGKWRDTLHRERVRFNDVWVMEQREM